MWKFFLLFLFRVVLMLRRAECEIDSRDGESRHRPLDVIDQAREQHPSSFHLIGNQLMNSQ